MKNKERELSRYIDRLNAEKKPNKMDIPPEDRELDELFKTVRAVRSLKEPVLPDAAYSEGLVKGMDNRLVKQKSRKENGRRWYFRGAAVAALILVAFLFNFIFPFGRLNIASAMEKAFKDVKAYHGILEIVETNLEGSSSLQAKLEVWADKEGRYYIKQLEGSQAGLVTVNNAQRKWQMRPDVKESIIFSAFPDPYRYIFELGKEIESTKNALHTRVIGEDTISGRITEIVEVTPQGGAPYRLWIDKETHLPLQKQSPLQNALQYKVTYSEIKFGEVIPEHLMVYALPEGFKEVKTNTDQIVNNSEEAKELAGFYPDEPESLPEGYSLEVIAASSDTKSVKLKYISSDRKRSILIIERKADEDFKPVSNAVLGKVGDNTAEYQSPVQESGIPGIGEAYSGTGTCSVRWQKDGFEYAVIGESDNLETIKLFITGLSKSEAKIPSEDTAPLFRPQVEVPVDLEVERNDQLSVDAGHSPWRLDPVFVAQVFVSLKISPEGITGDYPIKTEDLKVTFNNGKEAIIEVSGDVTPVAPVSKVYLKRLIRQDSTGIWTVVGYDPV